VTGLPSRPVFRADAAALRASIAKMDASIAKTLAARPWNPAELRGPMILALDNAAKRASIDVNDAGIAIDLERVACLGAALFGALVAGAGTTIEAPLPGSDEVIGVTGVAPSPSIGEPIYWRQALLAALAVRHARAISLLANVPVTLLRDLAPTHPGWFFLEAEALQALALRSKDVSQRLVAAARAADPATVDEAGRDWVLEVVTPELQLAFRALDRDQAEYDRWIEVAIKAHHRYYQDAAERSNQPLSQLALAPLAMACVAHDLGIRTSVESDYLPRHIIGA
jgi:hypothetical protein